MSTLADELLNDFEDSGSEGEAENGGLFPDHDEASTGLQHVAKTNGDNGAHRDEGGMELDGDEEEVDEEDAAMGGTAEAQAADLDDEEATKARVEKMELGAVDDVRSVAGLMKTLEPVLEVCFLAPSLITLKRLQFTSRIGLTTSRTHRKSHIISLCQKTNKPPTSALSKTTRNTTS